MMIAAVDVKSANMGHATVIWHLASGVSKMVSMVTGFPRFPHFVSNVLSDRRRCESTGTDGRGPPGGTVVRSPGFTWSGLRRLTVPRRPGYLLVDGGARRWLAVMVLA